MKGDSNLHFILLSSCCEGDKEKKKDLILTNLRNKMNTTVYLYKYDCKVSFSTKVHVKLVKLRIILY